ncbi:MAG: flavin reductase family protein [Microbacterium sp.]|uniref:flavin reductase family protein n=1 Tax=Microbacterium sp. TaxID=51671 RepID=UPI0039E71593
MSATTGSPAVDPAVFRAAMGLLPTAVSVVSAEEDGHPVAMVVGTLTSVSLDPPLIAVLPMRSSRSWARIARTGGFVASVLSGHQRAVVERLSGRSDARFQSVDWERSLCDGPAVAGSLAQIDARIEAEHEAGDHDIVVARVVAVRHRETATPPLVFFRRGYHRTLPVEDSIPHGWY